MKKRGKEEEEERGEYEKERWLRRCSTSQSPPPSVISRVNISQEATAPPLFNYHQPTRGFKQPSWPFFSVLNFLSTTCFICDFVILLLPSFYYCFPLREECLKRTEKLRTLDSWVAGQPLGSSFKVWLWMIQPKSWQIVCPFSNRIKRDKQSSLIRAAAFKVFTLCIWHTTYFLFNANHFVFDANLKDARLVGCPMSLQLIERFKFKVGWLAGWKFSNLIFDQIFFIPYHLSPKPYFDGFSSFLGHLYFALGLVDTTTK